MLHRLTAPSLPARIVLGPPLHRRLALAWAAAVERRARAWQRRAQERAARRAAAAQHEALAGLDARTLRDIGLGDWVTPRSQEQRTAWIETDANRF